MDIYAPHHYREQIERLHRLSSEKNMLHNTDTQGQNMLDYYLNRKKLANIFSNSIRKKQYKLQPPRLICVRSNKTKRLIYNQTINDLIVISVIAKFLEGLLPKETHLELPETKITCRDKLIKHIQKNSEQTLSYFHINLHHCLDSIPVFPGSSLWQEHEELLKKAGILPKQYLYQLIQTALRPSYYNFDGLLQENLYGTAQGTAVNNYFYYLIANNIKKNITIFNSDLFLTCGKNLLFCSYDTTVAEKYLMTIKKYLASEAIHMLDNTISVKQLSRKKVSDTMHTDVIKFLGYKFRYNGTCSSREKQHYIQITQTCIDNIIRCRASLSPIELCRQLSRAIDQLLAENNYYYNKELTDDDRIDIGEEITKYLTKKIEKIKGHAWGGSYDPKTITILQQERKWLIHAEISEKINNE